MLTTLLSFDYTLVLAFLLALSEALALIPFVRANSVFQLVVNVLKTLKDKFGPQA